MEVSGRNRGLSFSFLVMGPLLLLAACASDPVEPPKKDFGRPLPEGAPALVKVSLDEWPDLRPVFSDRKGALIALEESLQYFQKPSSREWFPYATADRSITHKEQVETLTRLKDALQRAQNPDEFQGYCLLSFDAYKSVGWDGSGEVLFTAYCEPIFDGRLQPEGEFQHPLYGLPAPLAKDKDGTPLGWRDASGTVRPSPTRADFATSQALKGLELVYLRDPFEVYIAQIQGSARINLPDGKQLCVGYAGKTEHPYESIGLWLVEQGRIPSEELSLTTLKQYFRDHPEELEPTLAINPCYVFFLEREPGPFGSIGARVTPYHTLATDKSVFPRGGPCIVECRLPVAAPGDRTVGFRDATCLAFDQDTGGAIRSAGRADLFVGTGDHAERLAGMTREVGRLFYLFVRPASDAQAPGKP